MKPKYVWALGVATLLAIVGGPLCRHLRSYSQGSVVVEGFESGGLGMLPWDTGGDAYWYVTSSDRYEGTYSARAGSIGHGESSWLEVTVNVSGFEVSFWYRVSSEEGYDSLDFYIDGIWMGGWSGETGWQRVSFTVTPGIHTLTWEYSKDGSHSAGYDTAWIDLVTLGVSGGGPQSAGIMVMDSSGSTVGIFGTIQKAIEAAPSGATILVPPGIYRENVWIIGASGLTLRGAGQEVTVLDASGGDGPGIYVRSSSNVTISSLTVENARESVGSYYDPRNPAGPCGILVRDGSSVLIRNCTLRRNKGPGLCAVSDKTITRGIIYLTVTLEGSTVTENRGECGVAVGQGARVTIKDASITKNEGDGVHAASECTITNSTIAENDGAGIEVQFSNPVTEPALIQNCIIRRNGHYGILIRSDGTITGNVIEGNFGGIYQAAYGARLRIVGNTIRNNYGGCGLRVADAASILACAGNAVYGNSSNRCDEASKVCP